MNLPAVRRGGLTANWAGPADGEGGAGNGVRTRDIQLGRLTLYQLSYSRMVYPSSSKDRLLVPREGFEPP